MRIILKRRDILDESADALICPANVYLNLSGGVGGEILLRYGDAMQKELHAWLARARRHFVKQGEVIPSSPCGTSFRVVLHAVAVDAFYQTSSAVIESIVAKSLQLAASFDARKVVLAALGTGFGRLSMYDFGKAVAQGSGVDCSPVETLVICVRKDDEVRELAAVLPGCVAA